MYKKLLIRQALKRFRRDDNGTTAIEFAVVAPMFFLVMFATFEFGLVGVSQMVLQAAVADASRAVSISAGSQPGADTVTQFETLVRQKTSSIPNSANITFSSNPLSTRGSGGVFATKPEICFKNGVASSPPSCEGSPFQDTNGNGTYDPPGGKNFGDSGVNSLVEVQAYLPWTLKFPFLKSIFSDKDNSGNLTGAFMLTATTVLKNE